MCFINQKLNMAWYESQSINPYLSHLFSILELISGYLLSSTYRDLISFPIFLEFYRLHGSYEALKGGTTCEALEDFTAGVCEMYEVQNGPPNLFKVMGKAYDRSSFMGCSIEVRDCLHNLWDLDYYCSLRIEMEHK